MWTELFKFSLNEPDRSIRHRLLNALATTPNPDRVEELARFVLNLQDNPLLNTVGELQAEITFLPEKAIDVYLLAVKNPASRRSMLDLLSNNLVELDELLGRDYMLEMIQDTLLYATPPADWVNDFRSKIGLLTWNAYHLDLVNSRLSSVVFWADAHGRRVCDWVSEAMGHTNDFVDTINTVG